MGVSAPMSFVLDANGNTVAPVDLTQRDPLNGGLSWTTTSSGYDHVSHQLSSPSFDSSDNNRGRYRSHSLSTLSPVMIKNHSRGKMNLYPSKDHFYSHALTLETQLKEFFTPKQTCPSVPSSPLGGAATISRQEDVTSKEGALLCMSVLEEMAERPGPYQVVLLTLKAHISRFIFAEIPMSPSTTCTPDNGADGGRAVSPASVRAKELELDERACPNMMIPYFDMCMRLKKEIQRLEAALGEARTRLGEEDADDAANVHAPSRPRTGADPNSELDEVVKAKEEEIRRLIKETGDLKKAVMEQMQSMHLLERQLEEQARKCVCVSPCWCGVDVCTA
jgi:hypothetical protein